MSDGLDLSHLTDKQAAFVREYLIDLNATQAAIRAGYSEKTADVIGCENLGKPKIAAALAEAQAERAKRTEVTADRVLRELARVGFADLRNLFEWDEQRTAFVPSRDLTADEAAAIASIKSDTTIHTDRDGNTDRSIKLELKTHDKLGALREIGKHLGIAENLNLRTPDGVQVERPELDELSVEDLKLLRQLQARAGLGELSANGANGPNGAGGANGSGS